MKPGHATPRVRLKTNNCWNDNVQSHNSVLVSEKIEGTCTKPSRGKVAWKLLSWLWRYKANFADHNGAKYVCWNIAAKKLTLKLPRSEEHTSELQSLMRISYAVFCLTKKKINKKKT